MKQNFFDNIDTDWGDLISDIYNKNSLTIEPEVVDGIKIISKSIVDKYDLKNVNYLTFAEGTEVIKWNSFREIEFSINKPNVNIKNIKTVNFPSSLRIIENFAFSNSSIETIVINSDIEYIYLDIFYNVFSGCKNLTKIIFNGIVKNIFKGAFKNCNITGELNFPIGLEYIGDLAFLNNKNITNVVFPEGLKTIGNNAFKNCTNITGDIIIPKSVNYISYTALTNCNNIKRIFISKEKYYGWHNEFNMYCNAEVVYY